MRDKCNESVVSKVIGLNPVALSNGKNSRNTFPSTNGLLYSFLLFEKNNDL
jgi:hypothetical protein